MPQKSIYFQKDELEWIEQQEDTRSGVVRELVQEEMDE